MISYGEQVMNNHCNHNCSLRHLAKKNNNDENRYSWVNKRLHDDFLFGLSINEHDHVQ